MREKEIMMPKLKVIYILLSISLISTQLFAANYTKDTFSLGTDSIGNINNVTNRSTIYDRPYSVTESLPNKRQLLENTGGIVGGMLVATGVMLMLPDDVTNWTGTKGNNIFEKWWSNIKKGPVVDKDGFIVNYILHPYSGAVYYMNARSAGYNTWQSLAYVTIVSSFIWECGLEAFLESPSWQDLISTPIIGAIMGEAFYMWKRNIRSNNYILLGSRTLGKVITFIIDPVSEIMDVILKRHHNKVKNWNLEVSIPSFNRHSLLSLRMTF